MKTELKTYKLDGLLSLYSEGKWSLETQQIKLSTWT